MCAFCKLDLAHIRCIGLGRWPEITEYAFEFIIARIKHSDSRRRRLPAAGEEICRPPKKKAACPCWGRSLSAAAGKKAAQHRRGRILPTLPEKKATRRPPGKILLGAARAGATRRSRKLYMPLTYTILGMYLVQGVLRIWYMTVAYVQWACTEGIRNWNTSANHERTDSGNLTGRSRLR
jgi:hypothetical protein